MPEYTRMPVCAADLAKTTGTFRSQCHTAGKEDQMGKVYTGGDEDKIQWHQAFVGAMYCELGDDINRVEFNPEHSITRKPLQMDLLIVKKLMKNGVPAELSSSIGKLFNVYNIIEYKSPDDALGIDAFFQAYTYACYYKSSAGRENERKERDITIIFVRQGYPVTLARYLESRGCVIAEKLPGISSVFGSRFFNIVIFITGRMSPENHMWLNALRGNMERENYGRLARESARLKGKAAEYGEAVLSVVDQVNFKQVQRWKEDEEMASLLYEARTEGMQQGIKQVVIGMLKTGKLSVNEIAMYSGLSVGEVEMIADKLNNDSDEFV